MTTMSDRPIVKIRVEGEPENVRAAIEELYAAFRVVEESGNYYLADQPGQVRCYLKAALRGAIKPAPRAEARPL
jgi:hypothetical protein